MKKSFRNPVTNILTGWGYTESNGADTARSESDDFNLTHGEWKFEGGQWVAYAPPSAPAVSTPLQFIERFTEDEQLAIVTAAMSTPALRLWYDKLMAAQEVVFDDQRLSAGLDALVAAGLISSERKAELLAP